MTSSDEQNENAASRRALVTGAAGFVGSTLCNFLRAQGWEVIPAVNAGQEDGVVCDITQPDDVARALAAAGELTHIFHLAAIAVVPTANADPARAVSVNLTGTINLLSGLADAGFQGRFINIGSADIYGPPAYLPVDEAHPVNPINVYAITKAAADHYCAHASRTSGFDIIRMRPFNHSGAGQSSDLFLSSCARQVAQIEAGIAPAVMKVGNLDVRRDFTHVDDIVRGFELAALRANAGEVYNICSGQVVHLREVLESLLQMSSQEINIEVDPERFRPVDTLEVCGSYEKLQRDTQWSPQKSMNDILSDLLQHWRTHTEAASA